MKKLIQTLPLLIMVLLSVNVSAQQHEYVSEMYLKGKWIASCPYEVLDHAGITSCALCPFVIDANDKSIAEVGDVEMNFTQDSIIIDRNGKRVSVPYRHDPDNHSFAFHLDGYDYNFRVFIAEKMRILEDKDGLLVLLKKNE
jgi:hypothetical protein